MNYPKTASAAVSRKNILIATAEALAQQTIARCFIGGYSIDIAGDHDASVKLYRQKDYDLAFLDLGIMPCNERNGHGHPYAAALDQFLSPGSDTEIVILCPADKVRDAAHIVRNGANSYLIHPIEAAEVRYVSESVWSAQDTAELDCQDGFWASDAYPYVKTCSPLMRKIQDAVRSVAPTTTTVLLCGETGTGKGLLAKIIHQHSLRGNGPFVGAHCGAFPENLLESELFGHEKGSFTGATGRKLGKFEQAQSGTIFLDEVGTMSVSAQVRLLKVLQERTFQRIGGEKDIEADVRVIAATNVDLLKMVENDCFRSDLYYRLNVFPIEIPPLRERKEDLPHLISIFLGQLNMTYGKGIASVHPLVLKGFAAYSWPGNIRELGNMIERAYILESSTQLSPDGFPPEIVPRPESAGPTVTLDVSASLAQVRRRGIEEIERKYIEEKLMLYRGRIDKTAESAGITPRQVHKLMTKYGIRKEAFKDPKSEVGSQ
jgi:DNA-binding NtrC family response regulator